MCRHARHCVRTFIAARAIQRSAMPSVCLSASRYSLMQVASAVVPFGRVTLLGYRGLFCNVDHAICDLVPYPSPSCDHSNVKPSLVMHFPSVQGRRQFPASAMYDTSCLHFSACIHRLIHCFRGSSLCKGLFESMHIGDFAYMALLSAQCEAFVTIPSCLCTTWHMLSVRSSEECNALLLGCEGGRVYPSRQLSTSQ
jgi:hypothetical protein